MVNFTYPYLIYASYSFKEIAKEKAEDEKEIAKEKAENENSLAKPANAKRQVRMRGSVKQAWTKMTGHPTAEEISKTKYS
jgi:hypothetical protein